MKYKTRNVYRFLRSGEVIAEGTIEEVAKKVNMTVGAVYQNAHRTSKGWNNSANKVVKVGKYQPVYEFIRKGIVEATGTQKEIADALFLSEETVRTHVSKNGYSKVEAKYLGTKLVKLEEDEG